MRRNYLVERALKIGGITFIVCLVIFGVGFLGFKLSGLGKDKPSQEVANEENSSKKTKEKGKKKEEETFTQNIAVFGVDKDEMLTDVIMVVHLDSSIHKVKALSVPRDTKVIWDSSLQQRLKMVKPDFVPGTSWVSKLNEVAAIGGTKNSTIEKNIQTLTMYQLERILGVKIDNYVIVNLDAFKKIVDAIDGVDVDVPQRMYWTDKSQGLYIDLQPGPQTLYGEQAEMFVRYRRYLNGDVDRIKMQQVFLKALAQKVLSKETLTKIPKLLPVLIQDVKTDINILDLPKYYSYLDNLSLDNVSFHTVPGVGAMENGLSYFFIDERGLRQVVGEVFYDQQPSGEEIKVTMPNISEPVSSEKVRRGSNDQAVPSEDTMPQAEETMPVSGETMPDVSPAETTVQGETQKSPDETVEVTTMPSETTEDNWIQPAYTWPESIDTWPRDDEIWYEPQDTAR